MSFKKYNTSNDWLEAMFSFPDLVRTSYSNSTLDDRLLEALSRELEGDSSWSNLSKAQRLGILDRYYSDESPTLSNFWNLFGPDKVFDMDSFLTDYGSLTEALENKPVAPIESQYLQEARDYIAEQDRASMAELDKMLADRTDSLNAELRGLSSSYDQARTGLLSSQYQQNSRMMDTLSSQMDRTRRNALEAGASAGLRLAGNVNTLLSTQNAQSQQSLETSNQLAQMLVNQRNAESSIRGRYNDYLSEDYSQRQGLRDSAESRAQQRSTADFRAAQSAYADSLTEWDKLGTDNKLWGTALNSKYSH